MRTRIALVYNPKGGSSSQRGVAALVHAMEGLHSTVKKYPTTPEPGSGAQLAKLAAAEEAEVVVGYGGDGTISQVAEGLIGTGTPMAAYPGGTGNMFARTFYPHPTPASFARMVHVGIPQPIDLLRLTYTVGGQQYVRRIINGAAFGCLSDAIANVSQDVKRIFGQAAYVANILRTSVDLKPRYLRLVCTDGGSEREFTMLQSSILIVANSFPPLASYLSRGCSASDGLMDVINISAGTFLELASTAFWTGLLRPDRSRFYQRLRTASLTVESDQPVTPNIDGDAAPQASRLQIDVEPGAARVILV
ncbi:MAG: hypothetical protein K2Z81_11340 [Cyanobacteria bacterium]|nr:hypothetical protein [Cyanobacteriota bacterium]